MEKSAWYTAAGAALLILSSFAAGTTSAEEGAESGAPMLEEVIVTATRRSETVDDVPISISVADADAIAATGSVDLQDIASYIPNFVFAAGNNAATSNIAIRGVFSQIPPNWIGFEQPASVYVDGVYVGKQFAANATLGGVERVEVLRGPQGTLFGKNTIAGAVNIISAKPHDELAGSASIDLGNRELVDARASVNIPLVEGRLAVKVSAGHRSQDGYVTNTFTGDDDLANWEQSGARLQLRFTPSESTTVDFTADVFEAESKDYFYEFVEYGPFYDGRRYSVTNNFPNVTKIDLLGFSLTAEHVFANGYTFTSISGWNEDEVDFTGDVEARPDDFFAFHGVQTPELFSQELRIASPADQNYDFVAGLYYFSQENTAVDGLLPGRDFPFPPIAGSRADQAQHVDADSTAAFVHGNYHVNERVTIFAGARYTDESKEYSVDPFDCPNFLTCLVLGLPMFPGPVDAPEDATTREPTWTLGVRFHPTDDAMVYASVSRGVKSAAFNNIQDPIAAHAQMNLTADAEFVTNYEVGAKTHWLDRRVGLNVAVYYMDYEDLQVRQNCQTCGPLPIQILSNAGAATSKGFEIEFSALATAGLLVTAGVGYTDATYDRFEDVFDNRARMIVDASGNDIPLAPRWQLNVALQHTARWGPGALVSRLDYLFIDERYGHQDISNDPGSLIPSQSLVNARIGYRPNAGSWGVSVWGKNLADDDTLVLHQFATAFGNFSPSGLYQEPRTYGLSLSYSF